ncbi:hypothetical protein [Pseudomonas aeruginosa]|uniref:hypothetical protein n=1 Tax=Pseudomonas aeruginosa TaxID=287 RepID=UPI00383ACCEC
MNWILRLGAVFCAGLAAGLWLSATHYRPQLDRQAKTLAFETAARQSLEALTGEQSRALGELSAAADRRAARAAADVQSARVAADVERAAAGRLLVERNAEQSEAAVSALIDEELGL